MTKKKVSKPRNIATSTGKRLSTGISGFDKLVSGGFKPRSINLVSGGPGCGKTIFSMHFLIDGIKQGEKCLYITFEERRDKLYDDLRIMGWDLENLEKEGHFFMIEYTPEQVKKLLIEGGGTIDALIEKHKIKRIVIDSISSFAMLYPDELEKKEAALALFNLISDWDCTAVLTAQDKFSGTTSVEVSLEFEADSIIKMYHVKIQGVRQRAIEILKMRGTKIPHETFGLTITNKGIVVLDKKVKF